MTGDGRPPGLSDSRRLSVGKGARCHVLVLYAGVLAGNAALRAEVVPKVPTSTEAEREARAALKLVKAESRRETTARAEERRCWAELLKRVFEVDGWACPHCNKPMKLRSIVIREPATTQVVSGLLRATGPPAAA